MPSEILIAADHVKVGDKIVHKLVPDFQMEVKEIEPCIPLPGEEPHNSFLIDDPTGEEDWVCQRDVLKVEVLP